ncbi:MAG TPA: hypothetical protein VIM61_02225 [Chthoniobacterales bacterium]|jgi:hypothetical protein
MLTANHRLVLQLLQEELSDSPLDAEMPALRAAGLIFSEMVQLSAAQDSETQLDRFMAIAVAAVRAAATVAVEDNGGGR